MSAWTQDELIRFWWSKVTVTQKTCVWPKLDNSFTNKDKISQKCLIANN